MRSSVLRSCLVVVLAIAVLSPVGAHGSTSAGKRETEPDWSKDPRSGAALNLVAARNPRPAPAALYPAHRPEMVLASSINDPTADSTARDTQSETTIATLGSNVIIGWNDSGSYDGSNNHFTGYSHSGNGGSTFTDRGALPASPEGDAGDPVLAVDQASGRVYLATLGFTTGENIQVFRSTDGGATFGAPVNGTPGYEGSGDSQDKEWMTVDNFPGRGRHNVYLCWARFEGSHVDLRFTRSTDGEGATFGPSGGLLMADGGQGCFVAVGPDHSVYYFWLDSTGGDNRILVRRSSNRGASFGPATEVVDLLTTGTNGSLGLAGGFRTNAFPHAAVNPVNGDVYVVYNDNPADNDAADIFYVRSRNRGRTWSAPIQVNDDDAGHDQFFPTVAAATDGTSVMFGYYSRINDPTNLAFHRRGRIGLVSETGAVGLKRSFQLGPDTPVAIGQDPAINSTYMGDYDQIAASPGFFHSSWADNRHGNAFHAHQPDVWYARVGQTPQSTNPRVVLSGSASIPRGSNWFPRATISNSGANRADDVFVTLAVPEGMALQSVVAPSGGHCNTLGGLVGC